MKKNIFLLPLLLVVGVVIATTHRHHASHHHSSHGHTGQGARPQQPVAPSNNPNNGGQQPYNPNNDGQQPYDPNAQNQAGGIGMANPNTLDQRTIIKTLDAHKVSEILSEIKTLQHNAALLQKEIVKHINAYSFGYNKSYPVESKWYMSNPQASNSQTGFWRIQFLNSPQMNFRKNKINPTTGAIESGEKVTDSINPFTGKEVTFEDMKYLKYIASTLDSFCKMSVYAISVDITAEWNSRNAGPGKGTALKDSVLKTGRPGYFVNALPKGFWKVIDDFTDDANKKKDIFTIKRNKEQ